ncbi:MAG: hypothetical protein IPI67_16615 [Myxococcales bacterium]|nr:hypothetical protein [Myxococcales bacterium]
MLRLTPLFALLALGCSEELIEAGRMRLVSGHEPDPFSVSPVPTRTLVEKEKSSGTVIELDARDGAVQSFSMGLGEAGRFTVRGVDEADLTRVVGHSLLIDPSGFAGGTLPLFVARAGEFGRPPGELPLDLGPAPVATVVASRYLLSATGSAAGLELSGYDFAAWLPIESPPALDCGAASCTPRSLAVLDSTLTLAVGDGWALWFDPVSGGSGNLAEPDGLGSFADVAGGQTLESPEGAAYIVGGTRESAPSSSVLVVGADGVLSHVALSSPRQGAAAVWVSGRGLLVVGGGDATSAGAELLPEGAKAFTPLPQAPDETRGAALVVLDSSSVLRLGGSVAGAPAASVELALGCAQGCDPKPAGDSVEVTGARTFSLGDKAALVVGASTAAVTRAFRFADGKATELELRESRSSATALLLPTGHVGLVGGNHTDLSPARTLELYAE